MVDIVEKDLTIQNEKGLHARAAATFVKTLEDIDAEVFVSRTGQTVQGESIMGLMMLAASKGSVIHIKAKGNEAQKAIDVLTVLINSKFGEE
ncbi:MAG TPA: HPr family phosphocarrier protein [Alphaproteobacteria bacterium]|nr:HPr family phosphocarrier protein [Alphaproteobacteria bacterium]